MKEKKGKILGSLLFIILILLFSLLIFLPKKEIAKEVTLIKINSNKFLSEKDYLSQSKLNDKNLYSQLTLPVIKDRFEKHPYIANADVELISNNTVNVILTEKQMNAVLLNGVYQYFISDQNEILPFVPNTKFADLPVITNPKGKIEKYTFVQNDDLTEALKIIYSAKLTDKYLFRRLSEINLRNGGDVVLMFSKISVPVIFGRGDEARKMAYLESFLKSREDVQNELKNINYVDLRFSGNIYAGTN